MNPGNNEDFAFMKFLYSPLRNHYISMACKVGSASTTLRPSQGEPGIYSSAIQNIMFGTCQLSLSLVIQV